MLKCHTSCFTKGALGGISVRKWCYIACIPLKVPVFLLFSKMWHWSVTASVELLGNILLVGTWLPPDDITDVSGNSQSAKADGTKPAVSHSERTNNNPQIPSHLLSYYSHISKIILGNSESRVKVCMIICPVLGVLTTWNLCLCIHNFHFNIHRCLCIPYRNVDIKPIKQAQVSFLSCKHYAIRM
jgi:hypothetical protein